MSFDVSEFRSSVLYDFARPALFDVSLTFPSAGALLGSVDIDGSASKDVSFKAHAASLPGDQIGSVDVNYFGRTLKVPSVHPSFPDFQMTIYNDEDFNIRNSFERWMSALNENVSNIRDPNFISAPNYAIDVFVTQYG